MIFTLVFFPCSLINQMLQPFDVALLLIEAGANLGRLISGVADKLRQRNRRSIFQNDADFFCHAICLSVKNLDG